MARAEAFDGAGAVPKAAAVRRLTANGQVAARICAFVLVSILAAVAFRNDGRLLTATIIAAGLALSAGPAAAAFLIALFRREVESESGAEGELAPSAAPNEADRGPDKELDYGPTQPAQVRQTLILPALQLWALAALAIGANLGWFAVLRDSLSVWLYFCVFGFALFAPLVGFGVEAIRAEKLPPRLRDKPEHRHITGFTALALIGAVVFIIILANWAATDRNVNNLIHAELGAWIVFALAAVFVLTAIVPDLGVPAWLLRLGEFAADVLRPIGRLLSVADSLLVYCVAPAAGATLRRRWAGRYAYLAAYMAPLGLMGYWLPAPLGLAPIVWALIAAVAISRRWAWVEDDRETAMLTEQFRSENLRVGFSQDLRDEALLAFVSMFFLVPLALRQAHEWGAAYGMPVFAVGAVDAGDLWHWIKFFGAELAKAVPFVDWAEIYNVEGAGPIGMRGALSQHLVFAARVLVDLLLLAVLLQALATLARNAKQIDMFKSGALDRFDPFIERVQFLRIVVWERDRWKPKSPEFDAFGRARKYSLTRLLELKDNKPQASGEDAQADRQTPDWALWAAATFLYDRDYGNANLVAELYGKLKEEMEPASGKAPNKDALADTVDELEKLDHKREIDDLNDVRLRLNKDASAHRLRQRIIALIARAIEDADDGERTIQTEALASALSGPRGADARKENRRVAFEGLKAAYLEGDSVAVRAFQRAARDDQAESLRREIAAFVAQNPRTPGQEGDDPLPTV